MTITLEIPPKILTKLWMSEKEIQQYLENKLNQLIWVKITDKQNFNSDLEQQIKAGFEAAKDDYIQSLQDFEILQSDSIRW